MSELKVNSIKGTGASTAAITIDSSSGGCSANITNNLSNRRININGQMSVAQRGTSRTTNGYGPDRYYQNLENAGSITHTISQQSLTSSDTPYSLGFRYFQRHALSAAGTANANASLYTQHTIEAQDMAQSGWDYTSSSSYLSISFWVRVSTSQKFYLNLRTRDGTSQAYNIPFTPSANTWTKVTAQVPGNSNLQFDTDTDKGLHLNFYKFLGTDDTGGSSENAWAAYSGTAKVPDMASTWLTAGASTFDLTGLQVEVGSVATDFEHRSFAQELKLCERYFHMSYNTGRAIGSTGSGGNLQHNGTNNHAGTCQMNLNFPVEMRADPTLVAYSGDTGNSGNWTGTSNSAGLGDRSTTFYLTNTKRTSIYINTGGSRVACSLTGQYTAEAEI